MKKNYSSRRKFIKQSVLAAGVTALNPSYVESRENTINRPPREVWIAGISQMELETDTPEQMVDEILRILDMVNIYKPDIICLPELFPTSNITQRLSLSEEVDVSEKVLKQFSGIAKEFQCYIICPVYTSEGGLVYNSAVVFGRDGSSLGEYRKIHPTEEEIKAGTTPGPLDPPVFQADFGRFGVQICFDMLWDDGWAKLREKGAELVFWPSAYAGGKTVATKAWRHKYVVASSTRKNTSRICDISGETITKTGIWDKNYYCAPVNLEKAFVHTWPHVLQFNRIRRKYGKKIRIMNFDEEEWSVLESLSPDVVIAEVLKEFGIRTMEQHIHDATVAQNNARRH